MRVAVVGAGVSGLVVAHLLHRAHDVTVFEANGYAGGHTNSEDHGRGELGQLRRINGERGHVEEHAVAAGTLELSDAIVHWWVLDDDHHGRRREAVLWASSGHVGAVFDDELYDVLPQTRGGYGRLQDFGIRFGYERVILHLEPQVHVGRLEANTARTLLLLDHQPLPWSRLEGDGPNVKVRQRVRRQRGAGLVIGPLKSRHARRDLPLDLPLAGRLASHVAGRDERELVFCSTVGTILDPDNVADRVLAPACAAAGVEWAGFHTFRHTVASRLFAEGRNVVQVQRWLGHHSASFTLDTYVHLLEADLGEPLAPLTTNGTTNSGREITAITEPLPTGAIPD